jgi:hypothetical protein
MAPKGSSKGKEKARAKMPTSAINDLRAKIELASCRQYK